MKVVKSKGISVDDLKLLQGNPVLTEMLRNSLVIGYTPSDKKVSYARMGLDDTQGLFCIRKVQGREDTIEILFENKKDLEVAESALLIEKLAQ